jgi:hypothetical protein
MDHFDSENIVWLDAGLLHLYSSNTVLPENTYGKLFDMVQPIWLNNAYSCCSNRLIGYKSNPYH